MGFPREENWGGSPFPSPGELPDPGIEPSSPTLQADSLLSEPPGTLLDRIFMSDGDRCIAEECSMRRPLRYGN